MNIFKVILIICLISLNQSVRVSVTDKQYPKLNGSEYILYGYNMLYANPVPTSLDSLQDNGWRQPIFDDDSKYYSDSAHLQGKDYSIPSGTYVLSNLSCSASYKAEEIDNTSSYQKYLKSNSKVQGKSLHGAFSGSRSFESLRKETKHSNKQIIQSTSKCLAYTVGVYDGDLPPLSQGFINSLKHLPKNYDNKSKYHYINFLEEFGTHYPKRLSMGALIGESQTYLKEDLDRLSKSGLDINATANLVTEENQGGGENQTKKNKENMDKLRSVQKNVQKISYGTVIPNRDDKNSWMSQILEKQPMPMINEFEDLPQLLQKQVNKRLFDDAGLDWDDVQKWGENLDKASLQYCVNMNNGDEDQCKIYQQTLTCSLCQQSCGGKYPYDGGSFLHLMASKYGDKLHWIKYTETFGKKCKNKFQKLTTEKTTDSVKLCCAQPYKKNDLVQTTYEQDKELEEYEELTEQSDNFFNKLLGNVPEKSVASVDKAKQQCRLCSSCGSGFSKGGGSMTRYWQQYGSRKYKHWYGSKTVRKSVDVENDALQYGKQCSGNDIVQNKKDNTELCCRDEAPMCQMCTSCGQEYPISKGTFRFDLLTSQVVHGLHWNTSNSLKARGKECVGSFSNRSVNNTHPNYAPKISMCCKNAQVEVIQN